MLVQPAGGAVVRQTLMTGSYISQRLVSFCLLEPSCEPALLYSRPQTMPRPSRETAEA